MNTLYRCGLVSRTANEASMKLLYGSLDLTFDTEIQLDRIPAVGHRSSALEKGIRRNPELMVECKQNSTHCPLHYRSWTERNRNHSFREHGRTLALLLRTLTTRNSGIPRTIKEMRFPKRYQYPWELGNDSGAVHQAAANIGPWLVDILELLACLETVENLGSLMDFIVRVPGLGPLQRSVLMAVATNDCWRDWDWAEYQNPRKMHYLDHFGIGSAKDFVDIHSGWKNLRCLSLGAALLQRSVGNGYPFAHLPNLRSLEVAGAASLEEMFEAIPPNQLSSISVQPGLYGDYASEALISYLQRCDRSATQRLTSLTMLAAVDNTKSSLCSFRLDCFISALLHKAPGLRFLHLALVPRPHIPPDRLLLAPIGPQSHLEKLYAPGPNLRDLKLAISAHDWSWFVPSLEASMFPSLRSVAITPAQHIDGLDETDDWGQEALRPVRFYIPPEPRNSPRSPKTYCAQDFGSDEAVADVNDTLSLGSLAVKAEMCRKMDMDLVRFFGAKEVNQGGVELKFIGAAEEDQMLTKRLHII